MQALDLFYPEVLKAAAGQHPQACPVGTALADALRLFRVFGLLSCAAVIAAGPPSPGTTMEVERKLEAEHK